MASANPPATLAPKAGFDLDLSNVLPGNTVNLTYTDTATNTQRQVSIVRVDDTSQLPLSNATGANPQRIGISFAGGMASVVTQLNAALGGASLQFSNPSGSTLRVVDNGSAATTVNAASVTKTATSLANGSPQLALFTDGSSLTVNSPFWVAGQKKVKPRPAPTVGEHSDDVLREGGFNETEIRALRDEGVIG